MEYLSKGNLRNYMRSAWPEKAVKIIARQLLEGLAAIHQEGFVHRALKPEVRFLTLFFL